MMFHTGDSRLLCDSDWLQWFLSEFLPCHASCDHHSQDVIIVYWCILLIVVISDLDTLWWMMNMYIICINMYHICISIWDPFSIHRGCHGIPWDPMGSSGIEAMMCNEGQIFAFDRDGRRLKTMMTLMQQRHVTCVEPAEKAEWPEWPKGS